MGNSTEQFQSIKSNVDSPGYYILNRSPIPVALLSPPGSARSARAHSSNSMSGISRSNSVSGNCSSISRDVTIRSEASLEGIAMRNMSNNNDSNRITSNSSETSSSGSNSNNFAVRSTSTSNINNSDDRSSPSAAAVLPFAPLISNTYSPIGSYRSENQHNVQQQLQQQSQQQSEQQGNLKPPAANKRSPSSGGIAFKMLFPNRNEYYQQVCRDEESEAGVTADSYKSNDSKHTNENNI